MKNQINPAVERVTNHIGIRNGRLLWVFETACGQLRMYSANGGVFIVQVFPEGGVEIFAPVSRSLSLDVTLAKLDEYINGTI